MNKDHLDTTRLPHKPPHKQKEEREEEQLDNTTSVIRTKHKRASKKT